VTRSLVRAMALTIATLVLTSCTDSRNDPATDSTPVTPTRASPIVPPAAPVLMPDLIGLPSEVAFTRLARLKGRHGFNLGLTWARPVVGDCETRPGTVARQHPKPGTPLEQRTEVVIRTAEMDLARFRGPCDAARGQLEADGRIARAFYRFAADPSLGAPFADDDLWVGIEGGPTAVRLDSDERPSLAAWRLDTLYAERSGPFSALDVVASSGGYFEVHDGIPGCAGTTDDVPDELAELRAITLTAPGDAVGSCMEWWGVTLFLDEHDLIHGVALRLGSP